MGLGEAHERLELSRVGGDLATTRAGAAHLDVGADERSRGLLVERRVEVLAGVGNVVAEHGHVDQVAVLVVRVVVDLHSVAGRPRLPV